MTARPLAALLCASLLIAGPAAAAPKSTVTATHAWCRAAPSAALAGGCYVTLTAKTDDRLVAVQTPTADHGEIHTMDMTGGIMRMRQLKDGILLPAGQPVELKPGARHLMIIGPKRPLIAGGVVPLTLRFEKAAAITVKAEVQAVSPAVGGQR